MLDDLRATRFDVLSSSGSSPETNGLLVADEAEKLLVHAVVATTHADAGKLPSLEARLTLSRPDGKDTTSVNLPLNFEGPSAVLSHVELSFPLTEGRRPASNWIVRLQVGSRILAERMIGVASRAQLGELAEVVDFRLLRCSGTNDPQRDIGAELRFNGSRPQTLIPVAHVRTPAPSSRQKVNVSFLVLHGNTVVNVLDQQLALGRNDNWVVGGEWTLSPPSRREQYCIAITIDGRVCGERALTVDYQELRVTDAQGRLVDVGGLPDNLDADADDLLSDAAVVRI